MTASIARSAVAYAALGWRVFPVGHDCRSPHVAGGCHAASADEETIVAWWCRDPTANVSLACGPASGVLALDIDAKGAVDGFKALAKLEAEYGPLPETVRSLTPSGGAHLLFAHPEGASPANRVGIKRYADDGARQVYHGLDVRSAGASICLAPSRRADGVYTWERSPHETPLAAVPGWLLRLMLSEPPARPPAPPLRLDTADRAVRYICRAVDGECAEVAGMKAGTGRNQRLFVAAAKLGELVGAGLLQLELAEAALERAASECGLVREDGIRAVRATITSGLRRGEKNPRQVAA